MHLSAYVASSWNSRLQHSGVSASLVKVVVLRWVRIYIEVVAFISLTMCYGDFITSYMNTVEVYLSGSCIPYRGITASDKYLELIKFILVF